MNPERQFLNINNEQKLRYDFTSRNASGFVFQDIEDSKITILTIMPRSATAVKAIQFQEFILGLIETGKINIIIDLSSCEFIDSTFLGAMVLAQKKILREKGNLHLVLKNEITTSTFIFTNLDKIFRTFDTISDAIRCIKNQ